MIQKIYSHSFDWVNPIFVKELRQGFKSNVFTSTFMLIQVVMILFVITNMGTRAGYSSSENMVAIFWSTLSFYLLGIVPMMGLNAIGQERDGARLELQSLTQLTSRKLLIGKWLALNTQGVLVTIGVIPYLITNYYSGEVDFVRDLILIIQLQLLSILLTGAIVGLSVIKIRWVRFVSGIGLLFFLSIGPSVAMFDAMGSGDQLGLLECVAIFSYGLLGVWILLEFCISLISPQAENNNTIIRLLTLLFMAISMLAIEFSAPSKDTIDIILFTVAIMLLFVSLVELLAEPSNIPCVYQPFMRFGSMGKIIGRVFLYPGWPSAILFICFVWAAYFSYATYNAGGDLLKNFQYSIILIGIYLFPFTLLKRFKFRRTNDMTAFLMLVALFVVLGTCVDLFAYTTKINLQYLVMLFPPSALATFYNFSHKMDLNLFTLGAAVTNIICLILLVQLSRKKHAQLVEMETTAIKLNAEAKQQPNGNNA